ncbi:PcfK-like family protein [Bacteroides heparinolyticus]|uniref:PcfK-like family protein n=1 Tax=Prevotella heparinolytica TaxID=28113 RepID=UPI00359F40D3
MDTFTKSAEFFKSKIQSYLEKRVEQEPEFKAKYDNPKKSLDECFKYICSQVYESGCCGFDDDEVFSMAVHYYDEKEITISEMPEIDLTRSRIVCCEKVELSEEEMAEIREQARQKAIEEATNEARRKLEEARKPKAKPITATPTTATEQPQLDLFGGM